MKQQQPHVVANILIEYGSIPNSGAYLTKRKHSLT